MKFNSKQDIEAPSDQVWAALIDFEAWERAAMRRGAEVARTDSLRKPGPGMAWHARFIYHNKERQSDIRLIEMADQSVLGFTGVSAAIEAEARVEVIEMSAKRSRIHVSLEVRPRSLGARLFLQSLRLARGRIDRKFDGRIAQLAKDIEQRHRNASGRV